MKVIANIPEEMVQELKDGCFGAKHTLYDLAGAICDGIILPDNATNGDMIKAVFPNCKDWKAKLEDNDGEVYEVHFVQLPNSLTVNKYEESWWNAPYEGGIATFIGKG